MQVIQNTSSINIGNACKVKFKLKLVGDKSLSKRDFLE